MMHMQMPSPLTDGFSKNVFMSVFDGMQKCHKHISQLPTCHGKGTFLELLT